MSSLAAFDKNVAIAALGIELAAASGITNSYRDHELAIDTVPSTAADGRIYIQLEAAGANDLLSRLAEQAQRMALPGRFSASWHSENLVRFELAYAAPEERAA